MAVREMRIRCLSVMYEIVRVVERYRWVSRIGDT